MRSKNLFVFLFFFLFLLLNFILGFYLRAYSPTILAQFVIMQIINIGVAYNLTELILCSTLKYRDLPKVDRLVCYPPVAILYVTFNDVFPKCLDNIKHQTYPNYDMYVLDDSTDDHCKEIIDQSTLKIIRRDNRQGFKAGALNKWLSIYSNNYKYFIICDSDSYIKDDFIENIIKYAEHLSNIEVAIFQSRIRNWNRKNSFPKIMGAMIPFYDNINCKLANDCEYIISWGHNNLLRTSAVLNVGGFDENYIAEDLAIGIKLIQNGFKCKLVNIISYEMIPETIESYSKRQSRWARQNLELMKLNFDGIDFSTRLHIFMSIYSFLIWYFYLFGMILVIFGSNFDIGEFYILLINNYSNLLFSGPFIIYIFYVLNFTIIRLPMAIKLGIPASQYFKNLILCTSVGFFSMFDTIKEQTKFIFGYKLSFRVTNKTPHNTSFLAMINDFKATNLFIIFLIIGLAKNPFALVLNFVWLIPFILSPIIIYVTQKKATEKKLL